MSEPTDALIAEARAAAPVVQWGIRENAKTLTERLADALETERDAARQRIAEVVAFNAELLQALRLPAVLPCSKEGPYEPSCGEVDGDTPETACIQCKARRAARAVRHSDHPGAALLAEHERLRARLDAALAVVAAAKDCRDGRCKDGRSSQHMGRCRFVTALDEWDALEARP